MAGKSPLHEGPPRNRGYDAALHPLPHELRAYDDTNSRAGVCPPAGRIGIFLFPFLVVGSFYAQKLYQQAQSTALRPKQPLAALKNLGIHKGFLQFFAAQIYILSLSVQLLTFHLDD